MKKVVKCNDTYKFTRARQNSIGFEFVTGSDGISSFCRIRIGDTDPVSGMIITEKNIQDYYSIMNREIDHNIRAERVPYTKAETARRNEERRRIARDYKEAYGYIPDQDSIEYLLEEHWGNRYNLHLDGMMNDDGEEYLEWTSLMAGPSVEDELFGEEGSETAILREFAEMLDGRMQDVYALMLEKHSGGVGAAMGKNLAKKWNVCEATITKDQDRLKKMIREYFRIKENGGI